MLATVPQYQFALGILTILCRIGAFFADSFSTVATGGHCPSAVREVSSKSFTWGKD